MIIGLTGKAGAGKDTVADYLVSSHGFVKLSFASDIKAGLNAMFGWTKSQWEDREWKEATIDWIGKSPRQLAQTLGTEWGREQVHASIWLDTAMARAEALSKAGYNVVLSDVRFTNEAKAVEGIGGYVLRVDREVESIAMHTSEVGVPDRYLWRVIQNTGSVQDLADDIDNAMFIMQGGHTHGL